MPNNIQLHSGTTTSNPATTATQMEPFDLIAMSPRSAQPNTPVMQDQVFALIFNEQHEALILEAPPRGVGWPEWQLVCNVLPKEDDPLPFAKQKLLELVGYVSKEWVYLGSYRLSDQDEQGVGHFFCARNAVPAPASTPTHTPRWVKPRELRHALIDGRVSSLHFAIAISLGLLFE